jgi:hypothetical protein
MTQARLKKIFHENLFKDYLVGVPDLETVKWLTFINRFFSLMNSSKYYNNMISIPIVLVLDVNRTGTGLDCLDPNAIIDTFTQWNENSCNILILDIDGKVIIDSTYDDNFIDGEDVASDLSKKYNLILFYIKQLEVKFFLNGYCKFSADNIRSKKRTGEIRSTDLPPSEYRVLIEKHFNHALLKGKKITNWHDKSKKILRQKPENYFRDGLYSYLEDNLTPEGVVEKDVKNAGTMDEIDIRITDSTNGIEFIIIEVKWMGKALSLQKGKDNKGNDVKIAGEIEMGDDSPNEGIYQLGIYLENQTLAKCGSLVTYDARTMNNDINWNMDASKWHKKIDKPDLRLFIESDSASKKAKKLARQDKKNKNC